MVYERTSRLQLVQVMRETSGSDRKCSSLGGRSLLSLRLWAVPGSLSTPRRVVLVVPVPLRKYAIQESQFSFAVWGQRVCVWCAFAPCEWSGCVSCVLFCRPRFAFQTSSRTLAFAFKCQNVAAFSAQQQVRSGTFVVPTTAPWMAKTRVVVAARPSLTLSIVSLCACCDRTIGAG